MPTWLQPLRKSDVEEILEVQRICYGPFFIESRAAFESKILAGQTSFGIFESGRMLGYAVAFPWKRDVPVPLDSEQLEIPLQPDCLYLHDIAVSPAARGRGLGNAFVRALSNEACRLGFRSMDLVAVQGASSFWQQFGFNPIAGESPGYGSDAVKMRFDLMKRHNDLVIRAATLRDVDGIFDLVSGVESFRTSANVPFYETSELRDFIDNADWLVGVIEDMEGIVGFTSMHRMSWHWSLLDNFFVDRGHRGKGIGSELHSWLISMLKIWQSHYLSALVGEDDDPTRAFLASRGWQTAKSYVWMDMEDIR